MVTVNYKLYTLHKNPKVEKIEIYYILLYKFVIVFYKNLFKIKKIILKI